MKLGSTMLRTLTLLVRVIVHRVARLWVSIQFRWIFCLAARIPIILLLLIPPRLAGLLPRIAIVVGHKGASSIGADAW